MSISRRLLLAMPALAMPALALPSLARADDDSLKASMAERSIGSADARVTVTEWFSLTCPHCAHFALEFLPQIQKDQVDNGHVRIVFRDFPLDQIALTAAMVARSLPPDRYLPFVDALFASQNRWAFDRDADHLAEIAKMAALAGMPKATFDTVVTNDALRNAILAEQDVAIKQFKIDSTPSFVFDGPNAKGVMVAGALEPDSFAHNVAQAGG
jgi:protein-disulfide isomerase